MEHSPLQPTPLGAFRFNTDSSKLEYYDGNQWVNITSDSPQAQTGGTRGIWGGGEVSGAVTAIQYVNVDSTGDAESFGDLLTATSEQTSCASRTRGIFFRSGPGNNYVMTYVTIANTGETSATFGDMAQPMGQRAGCASSTRGLVGGGLLAPNTQNNHIDYITIATLGYAKDFGDLNAPNNGPAALASPTRGIFYHAYTSPAGAVTNVIDYVTIATLGNAADFGDSQTATRYSASAGNAVRGIRAGGSTVPGNTDEIDYITIATQGNATDFGNLIAATGGMQNGAASPTRGVFAGGYSPTKTDVISYVQFSTTGNASDFGNIAAANQYLTGFSNGHGGLG